MYDISLWILLQYVFINYKKDMGIMDIGGRQSLSNYLTLAEKYVDYIYEIADLMLQCNDAYIDCFHVGDI